MNAATPNTAGWNVSHLQLRGYYDPQWMGFRSLRVINDDLVMPAWFRNASAPRHGNHHLHPQRPLEHKDSMGNGRVIRAGECNTWPPHGRAAQRIQPATMSGAFAANLDSARPHGRDSPLR